MSKSKTWIRHNAPNSRIWTRYVEEGTVKDLNEGRRRVRRIESNGDGVVCAPFSVTCTHDIVIEGVGVLSPLASASHEPG